jgi:hypothetical protein
VRAAGAPSRAGADLPRARLSAYTANTRTTRRQTGSGPVERFGPADA